MKRRVHEEEGRHLAATQIKIDTRACKHSDENMDIFTNGQTLRIKREKQIKISETQQQAGGIILAKMEELAEYIHQNMEGDASGRQKATHARDALKTLEVAAKRRLISASLQ